MTIARKFYVTTPIFYVNAAPHIGHLYSAVIADCIFRYEKLRDASRVFRLSTGCDEHGSKIQQAAQGRNQQPRQYCDAIASQYRQLFDVSGISYTHFNRTSEQSTHFPAVHSFWNKLNANNCIYKANYAGWYCVPDETFLTESQLTENDKKEKVSTESGHPVQWVEETNYIFRLAKFQDDILYWIKQSERIKPKKFEKILLDYLNEPLNDISISRPSSRVSWGIPVPNDDTQTVYVWLDALINYLTSAGYPEAEPLECWPPQLHVIGKDILKFHGIYWPAFAIAAGFEPPERLLVHSHWTVDGQKMSKSKGNVVSPNTVAERYTFEGLRYFLLREGVAHSDGNYSDIRATRVLNSELADTFGNLLSRACAKVINPRQIVPQIDPEELNEILKVDVSQLLINQLNELPSKCERHYDAYNFYLAVDDVTKVLHTTNNFMETFKPWELRKDVNASRRLDTVLRIAFESLRITGIILQPIVPQMASRLLDKINVDREQRTWNDLKLDLVSPLVTGESGVRFLSEDSAILFKRIK